MNSMAPSCCGPCIVHQECTASALADRLFRFIHAIEGHHLDLRAPGFDASVLSAFRQRLMTSHAELLLCETMLTLFRTQGFLKAKGRQRTDSPHVLAAIQPLHRLEGVGATLRPALNVLA